ncbi:GH36-type glycosyl hydrolase domain-containing protein [Leptothrix discophora]|uniref:Glucoamylase family protein n=1 Tax=Leptothrix discophora TaxID=89 RepID=A0ABT9G8H1_LEPDI|nr:glucoamylase family protein [Leptothrix discophora]MDP4302789.1 glucoamylase family protein [Leptothrix discophora]
MADAALWKLIPGGATPSMCAMLDGIDGPLLPPIRSELFGPDRFAQHGRSLGATHRVQADARHPMAPWRSLAAAFAPTFVPRLKSNVRVLRLAHDFIGTQAASGHDVSPAAEWLLDNFHLIEAQLKAVHDGLPRRYFRSLPVLVDPPLAGLPRIYGVAWAHVAHTDGAFDEDLLVHFLNAYQETRPLSLRELWALPTTLRVVLIENLRRLAERVATNKAARELANRCCDQISQGHDDSAWLDPLLARLNRRGAGAAFLAQMAQRLHDIGSSGSLHPASRHREWLQRVLPQPAQLLDQQRADQTADNLSVSNAVRSLRAVGDADWPDMVARTSALMQAMLASPVFEAEDSASRDATLHGIEPLARRSGQDEAGVARSLLALMRTVHEANEAHAADDPRALAGHWLQGAGRPVLLRALGLREPWRWLWRRLAPRLALPAYLLTVAAGSAAGVAWLLPVHAGAASGGWTALAALFALLMAFPASEAVIAVIHRLISESTRPGRLPRCAFAQGLPAEHRVLVVIPTMLGEPAALDALLRSLRRHHLANPERHARYALLTDWPDAAEAEVPGDAERLAAARAGIEALNRLHPPEAADPANVPVNAPVNVPINAPATAPRFLLLHRARTHSIGEQAWIGWERKRGKLEQLVRALATGDASAFVDLGELSRLTPGTRHLVTLDSDTQLPPGRLRELVGIAAHPANAPRLDASGRRVVRGYGILQPRVVTPLPAAQSLTPFHALFAGQCGLDPYSAASSEVYQDLHGEGTFSGKGLLQVEAVHAVLAGRLPEGEVLSHDLLEGSIARCARVSDISLVEEAPSHADLAAARLHRWTRGDWQLLPILLRPGRYPMEAVNRWKMLDNLRRSLVAPMTWAMVVLSFGIALLAPPWPDAAGALRPAAAVLLAGAAFVAGPLLGALAGLVPTGTDHAWRHHLRHVGEDLLRVLGGGLWHLAMLQQHALDALDAVGRALHRLLVSRRHLLQWMPSGQTRASLGLRELLAAHAPASALALVMLAAVAGVAWAPSWLTCWPADQAPSGTALAWAAGAALLWLGTPLWTRWVSRPRRPRASAELTPTGRHYLHGVARDSWRLFERCVGPADHHLPPDNLQTDPQDLVAHRTSPTNIGLYLLSAACARAFGWIDSAELASRLEATLDTLDRLERHRGHFLNWYDTAQATPLLPMYVSTVDSGNLSGHLLALAQACLDEIAEPWPAPQRAALAGRLQALSRRCQRLAWEAEFGFLHHRKRRLLHIGYRVAEQQLDAGFYDLLASESRLTSLLAIAKGDVPVAHWAALGRPFYALGSRSALRSWSGSMFEYLMPTLVLAEPQGSVLREACGSAIREQIAYGNARGVPWGISECAHAGRDHTLTYQYAPQGVPRLALRRTPPDELVVAPYASALAAQLLPHLACLNLMALEDLSARGACGFVDALDYSPARLTVLDGGATRGTPVSTFMAHHQGMTIVALANVLLDGLPQRWGMADPHLDAVASLLHELPPREVSTLAAPPALPDLPAPGTRAPVLFREVLPGAAAVEPTHAFGNGRLGITLRANGCGTSRWGEIGLHRQRDDALRDAHGSFLFLRRPRPVSSPGGLLERLAQELVGPPSGSSLPAPAAQAAQAAQAAPAALVSLTAHPAPDPQAVYRSVFHADRVSFEAEWPDLLAQTTVWVSPEDDVEFRQVEWRNLGDQAIEIELVSAFDVTLSDPRADEAHPAFGNLFVGARWLPAARALLFERKARLVTEQPVHLAHVVAACDPAPLAVRVQTGRLAWLGRPGRVDRPQGLLQRAPADECTLATGLDPVSALAVTLRVPAHGKARVTFATAIATQQATVLAMVDKYRQREHVRRASLMSATLAGIRQRSLGLGAEPAMAVQSLTTALLMTLTDVQDNAADADLAGPVDGHALLRDRRRLWRLGISGDRPWLLVSVGAMAGLGLVRALVQALRGWAWAGIACDLVVIDTEPASYHMSLHHALKSLAERHGVDTATPGQPARTAVHLVHASDLDDDDRHTLRRGARARFVSDGRPLLHHVQDWLSRHELDRAQRRSVAAWTVGAGAAEVDAATAPGIVAASTGQFIAGHGEFRFDVGPRLRPQRPWVNVLANPAFGCLVSESGAGHTWAGNSRLHQLTAWSNDAVADPPGECFLLQLHDGRRSWSLAPSAWGDPQARYRIAHGQGITRIVHRIRHDGVELLVSASWCVDADLALKQVRIQLSHGDADPDAATLSLRLVGLVEWVMGARRADRASVDCAIAATPGQTVLLATQGEQADGFGGATAFMTLQPLADAPGEDRPDWTCDRREFLDDDGRLVLPERLGRRSGRALDPCAALSVDLALAPGQTVERVFLIGHGDSRAAALRLARGAVEVCAEVRQDAALTRWDSLLGAVEVRTPDPLFDALVNRWLVYQSVACRLWAKAGHYQAGGATGFRDQLQDTLALAWSAPELLRQQILLCASRQYATGDVQHWWHAPGGAGVRTRFSDDLLWLPHACAHHLARVGDDGLLDVVVPFLEGGEIPPGAEDLYETPQPGAQAASVYEHAARAIDRSLRSGAHGLPLMGSGDWNDGMNRVGHEGRGESVWLAWFLCALVRDVAPIARQRGEAERAQRWQDAAAGWAAALDGPAWDGQWYRRAFFDDGSPLGASTNAEARIDLIAQAWSVFADVTPRERQLAAMDAAQRLLVDPALGLTRLLDPPFARSEPSPGYIQAYPPGIRENGGQYTHAAVWALMAQAELARRLRADDPVAAQRHADAAWQICTGLSPAHRSADPLQGPRYLAEPYAIAGDIYSQPPCAGQAGWSWYTGSASWLHRAAIESILGLQMHATRFSLDPSLPSHWPGAELTLRRGGLTLAFEIRRVNGDDVETTDATRLVAGQSVPWQHLSGLCRYRLDLRD